MQRVLSQPHIDSFIRNVLDEWNCPGGISVALVQKLDADGNSWNIETKGYGYAKSDGTKVTGDTLFGIASNSKLFTCIAAGLLVSDDKLSPRISWNTKIRDILPDWELMDPVATQETTIVDAMSHRTGLPRHELMYSKHDTTSSILARLKYLKPSAGFCEVCQYNNIMYTVLSQLPPLLTKTPFPQYVKQNIFDPLGMKSTTYSHEVAKKNGNLAEGFGRDKLDKIEDPFGKGVPRVLEWPIPESLEGQDNFRFGAGGVITCANDAAIWLQTLLLEGRHPVSKETVIPAEIIKKVSSPVTILIPTPYYPELSPALYGGGQRRVWYRGHEMLEHGGDVTGFTSRISRFPKSNFGIAIFTNDDTYGTEIGEIVKYRIIDEILGLEVIDWSQRMKESIKDNSKKAKSQVEPPPLDKRRSPATPVRELAGTYHNPGYGDVQFELVSESADNSTVALIAKWDKYWSSHIRLDHFDGNLFNVSTFDFRPIISPQEEGYWTAPTYEEKHVTAEFSFSRSGNIEGFGLRGNFWGAGIGVEEEEKAEVWFSRISV